MSDDRELFDFLIDDLDSERCPECDGDGKFMDENCGECEGYGYVPKGRYDR